ncbi:Nuclear mitotic apparatus 1 [Melia azedarach]|uniref:Nuclear mitotic apparatus 1 n=1 Tax=Melia azedarach TaxID=155640 RepID=A0ACC1XL85_MELAZ|nr:Nuclear mitotic apparatus 1 [Melia azedarach]
MSDSEKLMALKKAYADIILNTAKEAAARIMVSERKAMRCQQELFAAKEDALRMLIRLKQMLDAKINEAQVASLCQQQKIEELEAQLGEAEDIVKDLRAELREAQDELERATINQKQLLNEQNSNGDAATLMTASVGNRFDTSEAVMSSLPDTRSELVMASDVRNSTLNGTYENNKCYSENGSHKDNCYFCNSDFASIVMRRKEPKLYRNGCTQRIHAFERNLLERNLSLPGQVEDVKNGICTGEDDKELCKNLDPEADKMCAAENNPNEIKLIPADSNCVSAHAFKSFRRKRKRAARYRKSKTHSARNFPDQVVEATQKSDISSRSFPNVVDNNVDQDNGEVTKNDTVQNTANNDDLLTDTLELTRLEHEPAQSTDIPACKTDLEAVNISLLNSDVKSSSLTEGITIQSPNDKFLKYTFQRKRKKESLSSPDGYSSFEEGVMKRKMVENVNSSLESANSNSITESSRDSRYLVQVACQLISLSEKKLQ